MDDASRYQCSHVVNRPTREAFYSTSETAAHHQYRMRFRYEKTAFES